MHAAVEQAEARRAGKPPSESAAAAFSPSSVTVEMQPTEPPARTPPSPSVSGPALQPLSMSGLSDRPAGVSGTASKEMAWLRPMAFHPERGFCVGCGTYCLLFVMWVLLIVAVPGFLPFSADVPLFLRGDQQQQYMDAVKAGQRDAKFSPTGVNTNLPRSVTADENGEDLELELIYEPSIGDVFEIETLRTIRSIEQRIMQMPFWRRYCALDWNGRAQNASLAYEKAVQSKDFDLIKMYESDDFLQHMPCALPETALAGCVCPEGTALYTNDRGVLECKSAGTGRTISCNVSHPWPRKEGEVSYRTSEASPVLHDPSDPDIRSIPSFPPGLLNCRRPEGCLGLGDTNELFDDLDPEYVRHAIGHYARSDPFVDWSVHSFVFPLTDSSFGGGTTVGGALRSRLRLGLPIKGYKSADDDQTGQVDTMSKDVYDAVHGLLFSQNYHNVKVWYNGPEFLSHYIQEQIASDGMFAIGSTFFVWFYIVFMNGSWFLGTMGMGQIVMAFGPAYILYYMIGFRYFGTFNVLTIFIILGIGADDIFVLLDTWGQSEIEFPIPRGPMGTPIELSDEDVKIRRHRRLSWTWRRAAKAMLVTSATTMVSFLCTGTSSFPGIQTFGVFAAMLVLVNYCAVITFYPTAVMFYTVRFQPPDGEGSCCGCCGGPFCFDIRNRLQRLGTRINTHIKIFTHSYPPDKWAEAAHNRENRERQEVGQKPKKPLGPPTPTSPAASGRDQAVEVGGNTSELRGLELFFYKHYSPFVVHFRWPVFLLSCVFVVIMFVFMLQLEPDPDPPKFLPDSNNFGGFRPTKGRHFQRGGNVYAIKLRLVSGIDPTNPIDRAGTSSTDPEDIGDTVWSEWTGPAVKRPKPHKYTSFATDLVMEGLPCFEHLCARMSLRDDVRKVGGLPEFPIECWVQAFKTWVVSNSSALGVRPTHKWEEITGKADGVDYDGDGTPDGASYWDTEQGRWVPHPKPPNHKNIFWDNVGIWLSQPAVYDVWKKFLYGEEGRFCMHRRKCGPGETESQHFVTGCCNDPDDDKCACEDDTARFRFHFAEMKLTATSKVTFDDGLDLVDAWNAWIVEETKNPVCHDVCPGGMHNGADPPCAAPVFITDPGSLAFFKVQQVMAQEAFSGIAISISLAFVVITLATTNAAIGFLATALIACIVFSVMGSAVAFYGWKLGVTQAIVFVMVPGMSVDYVAHFAEAYTESHAERRNDKVRIMLTEVGISVVSGAVSTLGASLFLFGPVILFFVDFGKFMFTTIMVSLLLAIFMFPSLMAICGPQKGFGSLMPLVYKLPCLHRPESTAAHAALQSSPAGRGEPSVRPPVAARRADA
eukprot:TRINITY_DN2885_c0_g1_i1.p1 TRINITY_DN2885_c0_g1~~TRINITY_DN2885_c0_g1_i1.p1  ORF type:complete len:1347 (+),score=396.91 TRINITY_DN2885_c0_g1_i1:67-4041(+)